MKRLFTFFLTVLITVTFAATPVNACDEKQTDLYVTQLMFGENGTYKSSDENVKILLNALYLCSEQSDGLGQEKIDYLKKEHVFAVPSLSNINIKGSTLMGCAHNAWDREDASTKKAQKNRKKLLRNSVNKVFGFGVTDNLFGSNKGKSESFTAFLYYSHILADYLADNPADSEVLLKGKQIKSYSGDASITVSGNKPGFTKEQVDNIAPYVTFSELDAYGRAGAAIACIGKETLESVGERQDMVGIKPSGWVNDPKYEGIVDSKPPYLYNRCHLIAHQLGGKEEEINLVTGTRYLNESGMKPIEDKVAEYIRETNNHVLYRVTPIYKSDNRVCSGVQIEAYSIEDKGKGICLNQYCYNVQPGVEINYSNGKNEISDELFNADDVIPFAIDDASDSNPDLIFEMDKYMETLFGDQVNTATYISLSDKVDSIALQARALARRDKSAQGYIALKKLEYEYFGALKTYVPILLRKEKFFSSAFDG